jgi:acyl-CoA reductase-like NAD-dependent aldehyde dehydrogenase
VPASYSARARELTRGAPWGTRRADLLDRIAELIEHKADWFAALESRDTGKTLR